MLRLLSILSTLTTVIMLLILVSLGYELSLGWELSTLMAELESRGDEIDPFMQHLESVYSVAILFYLLAGVCFIAWSVLAQRIMGQRGLGASYRGWALWGWLVPFMNLYMPYCVMNDLWVRTTARHPGSRPPSPHLPKIWWFLFIAQMVLVAGALLAGEFEGTEMMGIVLVCAGVISKIGAAVAAILLVRGITGSLRRSGDLGAEVFA